MLPVVRTTKAAAPPRSAPSLSNKAKFDAFAVRLKGIESQDAKAAAKAVILMRSELAALHTAAKQDRSLQPLYLTLQTRLSSLSVRLANGSFAAAKASQVAAQALNKSSPKAASDWIEVDTEFSLKGRALKDFRQMVIVEDNGSHLVLMYDKHGIDFKQVTFKTAVEAENFVISERQKVLEASKPATPPAAAATAASASVPARGPTSAKTPPATASARTPPAAAAKAASASVPARGPTIARVPPRAATVPAGARSAAPVESEAVRARRNIESRLRSLEVRLLEPELSKAEINAIAAEFKAVKTSFIPTFEDTKRLAKLDLTIQFRQRLNEHEEVIVQALKSCKNAAGELLPNATLLAMKTALDKLQFLQEKITVDKFKGTLFEGGRMTPDLLFTRATRLYHQIDVLCNQCALKHAGVKTIVAGSFNQYATRNVRGGACPYPCTMVAAKFLDFVLSDSRRIRDMASGAIDTILDWGKAMFADYWDKRIARQGEGRSGFINLREISEQSAVWDEYFRHSCAVGAIETVVVKQDRSWALKALTKFENEHDPAKSFGFTLTTQSKTSAMVRLEDGQWVFFDSHGDDETIGQKNAFMIIFPNKEAAALYLTMHYPYRNENGDANSIGINFVVARPRAATAAPPQHAPSRPVGAAAGLIAALGAPFTAPASQPTAGTRTIPSQRVAASTPSPAPHAVSKPVARADGPPRAAAKTDLPLRPQLISPSGNPYYEGQAPLEI